jgi:phosphoribosylaminoimidazole-succinocarboxamide synthase
VSELRATIRDLRARIDFADGVHTADTNRFEWNAYTQAVISRYRSFVGRAAQKLHMPKSFLLEGIEDGSMRSWEHARMVHEACIHRAVSQLVPKEGQGRS